MSRRLLQGQINNALVPRCFEAEREDSKGGFGGRLLEEGRQVHSRDISVLLFFIHSVQHEIIFNHNSMSKILLKIVSA